MQDSKVTPNHFNIVADPLVLNQLRIRLKSLFSALALGRRTYIKQSTLASCVIYYNSYIYPI